MNTPQLEVRVPFFRRRLVKPALVLFFVVVGAVTWMGAQALQGGRIGPSSASPSYIVVNTGTAVTFTTVITDTNLRKHDPLKVLLVRTDPAGTPIDIVARMLDNGRRADATRKDKTYTTRVTLNESTVGPVYFKVAARFNDAPRFTRDSDDWDRDFVGLNDSRNRSRRPSVLALLLRRLQKYELSESIVVTVDPFLLPPDPGEAGKQTLEGIDSDNDGVRDDVQRYIRLTYSESARTRAVLSQYASSLGTFLGAALGGDPTAASQALTAAVDCATASPEDVSRIELATVKATLLNTRARSQAFIRASTAVTSSSGESAGSASCISTPGALPN